MKSYGQYCALARALDHVGDRWTLLIVRELLIAPRRYSQIREALPGVATNLLADRLRALEADELIRKEPEGTYGLTRLGRELESAIRGLVRWGAVWMTEGRGSDHFRPQWLAVALNALFPDGAVGRIEIHADDEVLHLADGRVSLGPLERPDAVMTGTAEDILAVAAGMLPISALSIRGDSNVVTQLMRERDRTGITATFGDA
jgi:DNA-binding HxlR family transcriptional regulator